MLLKSRKKEKLFDVDADGAASDRESLTLLFRSTLPSPLLFYPFLLLYFHLGKKKKEEKLTMTHYNT